jgi:diguanylate cyclase (GGDEF)-like protein
MALDTGTLRVAFAAVALALLAMFSVGMRGQMPSAYRSWWCAAIALFLLGDSAYLLNGTPQQVWANPAGNVLSVLGATSVWAGARSLRARSGPGVWRLLAGPVLVGVAAALDRPGSNIWAGGAVFLGLMGATIGLSAVELWRSGSVDAGFRLPLVCASALVGAFYGGRCVAFVVDGPSGRVFTSFFGSGVTTVVSMALLVVVSFSMSAFSADQAVRGLRERAAHDGLTGLLNRCGFLDLAVVELRRLRTAGTPGAVVLADLDHFKAVNDTYGHAAGAAALRAFAAACTGAVRSTDLVGRYGGEEFVLLLPGADVDVARAITEEISRNLGSAQGGGDMPLPTASYGIAPVLSRTDSLEELIRAADAALYRAKALGRNRTAVAR